MRDVLGWVVLVEGLGGGFLGFRGRGRGRGGGEGEVGLDVRVKSSSRYFFLLFLRFLLI